MEGSIGVEYPTSNSDAGGVFVKDRELVGQLRDVASGVGKEPLNYGPWMISKKSLRKKAGSAHPNVNSSLTSGTGGKRREGNNGSRFDILQGQQETPAGVKGGESGPAASEEAQEVSDMVISENGLESPNRDPGPMTKTKFRKAVGGKTPFLGPRRSSASVRKNLASLSGSGGFGKENIQPNLSFIAKRPSMDGDGVTSARDRMEEIKTWGVFRTRLVRKLRRRGL